MRDRILIFLSIFLFPLCAFSEILEGVPLYYSDLNNYNDNYQNNNYLREIQNSGQRQIIGTNKTSYKVPKNRNNFDPSSFTANGISGVESKTFIQGNYTRKFADFVFVTGVNSILEWDDMVLNEVGASARHSFDVKDFDMFVFGEYKYGNVSKGGFSMDYDLKPYNESEPKNGIFTISMGDQSGYTNDIKIGLGAKNVWDVSGWKLSPSFGYQIFKHNLQMSNHVYPNPGIYLPLMTSDGKYIFGDSKGNYHALDQNATPPPDWRQICLSPGDIKVVPKAPGSSDNLGSSLTTQDYDPHTMGKLPWGVGSGECVIVGGDGARLVPGTTHIYNTTWSGFYIGLEISKQMTLIDKLRFYFQAGMPNYSSEGIWPNRTDWQQNPSFIDKGNSGSYNYNAEIEYTYKISDKIELSVAVDTSAFHVGNISGELYVAAYRQYKIGDNGKYELDSNNQPIYEDIPAHTESIEDSLKNADWQSFGLRLSAKYLF